MTMWVEFVLTSCLFSLMQNVLSLYREGNIRAAEPLKVFDVSEISEAFHYASAENHLGSVAVSLENRNSKINVCCCQTDSLCIV